MNSATTISQLRNFGLTVGTLCAGLFGLALPWIHRVRPPVWPWALGLTLVTCALLAPALLRYPFLVWDRTGRALGWVNSRIVLNLLFFVIFVPAGIVARFAGWDPMRRKFEATSPSYRIPSAPLAPSRMEKPY